MKRVFVVLASGGALVALAAPPVSALDLDPVPLRLVDVPVTVPAASDASVGSFVPRGSRCRLVLRDAGASVWKGPRARATSGFMQFPWTQPLGSASGEWRLRVKCRTDLTRWKSDWAGFNVPPTESAAGSVPTLNRPASASLSSVPAAYGWAPFGTTLIKGTDWFAGRGVDVRSNGGNGCASGCAVRGSYGTKYQCVELVNRFVRTQGWVTSNIMGNAGQLLANAPEDVFDKHRAGDGYLPVPGDVIVWTGGSTGYGHVAVVSAVVDGVVTFVEQNASRTGTYKLKASEKGRLARYGALQHIGYLHAKVNA
ncbi:MAG TPA: CHAP domain-containing protein [Actinomycetota bacterium]|nr:CHAP domain-containing protein [Actinomycetota bacterium]